MNTLFILFTFLVVSGFAHAHIYSSNLWTDYKVTVCFSKGYSKSIRLGKHDFIVSDWSELEKQKVKAWVMEDFSYKKTGIHFTGFKECDDTPHPDVIVYYTLDSTILNRIHESLLKKYPKLPLREVNPPGIASVGMNAGLYAPASTAESFVVLGTSGMNKRTVIHEFGHVAGFSHEHIHPDAIKVQKNCYHIPSKEKIPENSKVLDYDKSSVMNYCTFVTINMMKGLSPMDEKVLREIYP